MNKVPKYGKLSQSMSYTRVSYDQEWKIGYCERKGKQARAGGEVFNVTSLQNWVFPSSFLTWRALRGNNLRLEN